MNRKKIRSSLILLLCLLLLSGSSYASDYYRSTDEAEAYLEGAEQAGEVSIKEIEDGLFLDGPGNEDALIFYPGAKVEYSAYIPLLYGLADQGMDVFLIHMPSNLAIFGRNKADDILGGYSYENYYIGGHSLGGAMSADYAADYVEKESKSALKGLILLAAYPTKDLSKSDLKVLTIYGSEDGVLSMEKLEEGRTYLPKDAQKLVIEGGNHAQFGSYGEQKGDGKAFISAEEQREETTEAIVSLLNKN